MGGTKIFVIQMNKLLRIGAAALVGIAAIVALILLLLPDNPAASAMAYVPGTYTACIVLHNKPVNVEVTVSSDEIVGVGIREMNAAQSLAYPLFKPTMETLSREIIRKQSTNVSLTAENQITGRILLDAVDAAIAQAAVPRG